MKRKYQGKLNLILLGVLSTTLVGCADNDIHTQSQVTRAGYKSLDDCLKDWEPSDCEKTGSSTTSSGHGHVYTSNYVGPYYNSSGQVYRYDGTVSNLNKVPVNASQLHSSNMSVNEMNSSSAKYATTSKVSRGGFGSFGRGASAGG